MTSDPIIHTTRLQLRQWRDDDLPAFAAMNADPRVMEFFPSVLDRAESDAQAARIRGEFSVLGFGRWAVEVLGCRRVRRLRRPDDAQLPGCLHAVRRDRLAARV